MEWPLDVFERTLLHISIMDPKAVTLLPKRTILKRQGDYIANERRIASLGVVPVIVKGKP
jgi:hypothetical protein